MGPVAVVVRDLALEDALEMATAEDEDAIQALRRSVPTNRSANAVARGARIGVRTTSTPSEANTSSKPPAYFESRSRMRKRNGKGSRSTTRLRACWVTQRRLGDEGHWEGAPHGPRS